MSEFRTVRSVTYERLSIVTWWIGWIVVCVSISAALGMMAYDWVLR